MHHINKDTRFYGVKQVRTTHDLLTGLASTVGMLMVGIGYNFYLNDFQLTIFMFLTTVAYTLVMSKKKLFERYCLIAGAICIFSVALRGYRLSSEIMYIGAALIAISGLVGTEGVINGFKRVNLFHYLLASGMFLTGRGLIK